MVNPIRWRLVIFLAAGLLVLAGCGGADSDADDDAGSDDVSQEADDQEADEPSESPDQTSDDADGPDPAE